ncbi:hypothetical protein T484DRAFT_1755793 [Baffinella frigidus]|nr:hypothetical protein T484DRAFT_1755793 [Cryptophyta sp. CCMP2293]
MRAGYGWGLLALALLSILAGDVAGGGGASGEQCLSELNPPGGGPYELGEDDLAAFDLLLSINCEGKPLGRKLTVESDTVFFESALDEWRTEHYTLGIRNEVLLRAARPAGRAHEGERGLTLLALVAAQAFEFGEEEIEEGAFSVQHRLRGHRFVLVVRPCRYLPRVFPNDLTALDPRQHVSLFVPLLQSSSRGHLAG